MMIELMKTIYILRKGSGTLLTWFRTTLKGELQNQENNVNKNPSTIVETQN